MKSSDGSNADKRRRASDFIKHTALAEGFDLAGVAEAKPLGEESVHLRKWIERGYDATMDWIRKGFEKKVDPSKILPGARSVISLARNYYSPVAHKAGAAKISRYAWGTDYHHVIEEMLKGLVAELKKQFPENEFLFYCDTGPVMDKVWAQRAGLGWIGKHTNVINRNLGSWVFLAEIITDLECEFDEGAVDRCGSCRECIDACPTQAIVAPYVLDSNKCISFLTIENRSPDISSELSSKMENWVFGCDVCQDVCPWNTKFQTPTDEEAFSPHEDVLNLKPEDIHLMTREEFAGRFRLSPIKRARYEGFRRNAEAILNSKTIETENEGNKD